MRYSKDARLFREGTRHHQAGRLQDAERAYRQILAANPDHADSLHALGLLAREAGRSDLAIACIGKALALKPDSASRHIDLGHALLDRAHAEPARAAFHVATLLAPLDAGAHALLGAALGRLGRLQEAEASLRTALALNPGLPLAQTALGLVLRQAGRLAEAETCLLAALAGRPDDPELHNAIGATIGDAGRPEDALPHLREALRLAPDHADSHNNLGLMLQTLGRLVAAEASFRAALRLRPGDPYIRNHLGHVLRDLGQTEAAMECYEHVLRQDPANQEARFNAGTLLLLTGRFGPGWRGFECRRTLNGATPRAFTAPEWDGADLEGGALLVHAEQGIGDTIQFCRYLPRLAARNRVIVEAPRSLLRLLATLQGVGQVVARGDPLPEFDAQVPMLSLPMLSGTTPDSIPAQVPYLRPDATRAAAWHRRLAPLAGLRVGLCWAGNPGYSHDRMRSVPLERLACLGAIDGISLVSLQKPAPGDTPPGLALHDWTEELGDFADTAALIAALDLVISVDTAIAHLAGALARPVWLLNRFAADWRWLQDRDDSPWYPTLRQFRQTAPGDWDDPLARLRAALEHAARVGPERPPGV